VAAVTLTDLINPLNKISEYSQQTNKKLDTVIKMLAQGPTKSGISIRIDEKNASKTLKVLNRVAETFQKIDPKKTVAGAEAFSKSLSILNDASAFIDSKKFERFKELNAAFNVRLLGFALTLVAVSYMGPLMLAGAIIFGASVKLLNLIAGMGNLKTLAAMNTIYFMAKGALKYTLTMVLVAVLAPVVLIGTALFGLSLKLLTLFVGRSWKNIALFAALGLMGSAIFEFTITMVLLTLIFPYVLEGVIMFSVILGILSLATRLLGKPAQVTLKAAMFYILTPAIVIFSIGMALAGAILGDDIGRYASLFALLIGVSLVFKTLGEKKTFVRILLGSIALGVISAALFAFSYAYEPFANTIKGLEWGDIAKQAAVLTGVVGGVVALGTFGLVPALLGSLALAAVGGSLLLLAKGLEAIRDVGWTEDDSKSLFTTLAGIKLAFIGGKPDGFFANIGSALSQGVETAKMVASAAGFGAVGLSLVELSKGLAAFQKVGWTWDDSMTLSSTLVGVTNAFASAGGSRKKRKSIQKGIDSVTGAGMALFEIGIGLVQFKKLLESEIVFGDPENPEEGTLAYAVKSAVSFVSSAFSKIGDEKVGWFQSSKVKKGVESVMGTGAALKDIATGLIEFGKLVSKEIDFSPEGALAVAIKSSLTTIGSAFASIGEGTQLDFFGPFVWRTTAVAKGISAVDGAGKALTDVAKGIIKFNDLIKKKINFEEVGNAIKTSLTLVGDAFAIIGKNEEEDSALFGLIKWDENLVQKGIEAVKGAGDEVLKISTALSKMKDIDSVKVKTSIENLFNTLNTTFSSIYTTTPDIDNKMLKVGDFISILVDAGQKNRLMKTADAFQKTADAINSIELEKSDSLGNLFKYASELSKDEAAIARLAEAVNEIKNIMVAAVEAPAESSGLGQQIGNSLGFGATDTATGNEPQAEMPNMERLNSTLAKIDTTLNNLPSAIASIEIRIPED